MNEIEAATAELRSARRKLTDATAAHEMARVVERSTMDAVAAAMHEYSAASQRLITVAEVTP